MIQVLYNGADITRRVSINRCIHDMYAASMTDTLQIRMNDTQYQWDRWQPKTGDTIAIIYGTAKTGIMYVDQCNPCNGAYDIVATSIPTTARVIRSRAWQDINFQRICNDIAGNHGLTCTTYDVTDHTYSYILQTNESDFSFLEKLCRLEGYAFLIYDGALIVYDEKTFEEKPSSQTVTISADGEYQYIDHSARQFETCRIERGRYVGEFSNDAGTGKIYSPTIHTPTVTSQSELERFAKGLLRYENRQMQYGYIRARILPAYAAASTITLQNNRAPSWDGTVFIYHLRNDYANGKSKIFFRKPLGY